MGKRDYLQILLSIPIIKEVKILYVPLVMHIYPYSDSSPPKIILLPDAGITLCSLLVIVYGINPDADYVVGETVKTKYMERWEEDPDFVTVIGSNNT